MADIYIYIYTIFLYYIYYIGRELIKGMANLSGTSGVTGLFWVVKKVMKKDFEDGKVFLSTIYYCTKLIYILSTEELVQDTFPKVFFIMIATYHYLFSQFIVVFITFSTAQVM